MGLKILLMSGGSESRKWPLSGSRTAKQYLNVLEGPDGKSESMLQRLWRQLDAADLLECTSVATCPEQADIIKSHLGQATKVMIEPGRRGTFPTIALAASNLYTTEGVSANETLIVLPVNMYAGDELFPYIRSLPKLLRDSRSKLMLVGTRATRASEQFDYILADKENSAEAESYCDFRVKSFRHKPMLSEAERLLKAGALQSCGVYAFRLEFMLARLTELQMPVHYDELHQQYYRLRKQSMEEAVMDNDDIERSVIRYDGMWTSLGNGLSLAEQSGRSSGVKQMASLG